MMPPPVHTVRATARRAGAGPGVGRSPGLAAPSWCSARTAGSWALTRLPAPIGGRPTWRCPARVCLSAACRPRSPPVSRTSTSTRRWPVRPARWSPSMPPMARRAGPGRLPAVRADPPRRALAVPGIPPRQDSCTSWTRTRAAWSRSTPPPAQSAGELRSPDNRAGSRHPTRLWWLRRSSPRRRPPTPR